MRSMTFIHIDSGGWSNGFSRICLARKARLNKGVAPTFSLEAQSWSNGFSRVWMPAAKSPPKGVTPTPSHAC